MPERSLISVQNIEQLSDNMPSTDSSNCKHATIYEGKLNKRGKVNKAWKERWFVLNHYKQTLKYYPTEQDSIDDKNVRGCIDLCLVTRIETIHSYNDKMKLHETEILKQNKTQLSKFIITNEKAKSNVAYSFQIVLNCRTYILSAMDSKAYTNWLHQFCRAIYGGVVRKGLLNKFDTVDKSWKRRYFTLNKYKQMKYYADDTLTENLGCIDLNLCCLINQNDKAYTIEIQTPKGVWILSPYDNDKQQKHEWEKMIEDVQYENLNEKTMTCLIENNLKSMSREMKACEEKCEADEAELSAAPQHEETMGSMEELQYFSEITPLLPEEDSFGRVSDTDTNLSEEEDVMYLDHRRGTVEQYAEKNKHKSRTFWNFAQVKNGNSHVEDDKNNDSNAGKRKMKKIGNDLVREYQLNAMQIRKLNDSSIMQQIIMLVGNMASFFIQPGNKLFVHLNCVHGVETVPNSTCNTLQMWEYVEDLLRQRIGNLQK